MRFGRVQLLTAIALFGAVLLGPGPSGSLFGGVPLGSEGYALLGGLVWLAALGLVIPPARRLPRSVLVGLALLAVLKPFAGMAAGPAGWRGEYYTGTGLHFRESFKSGVLTRDHRIDSVIDFEGAGFGLHFLNDPFRYGRVYSSVRRDREFPLAVEWSGYCLLQKQRRVGLDVHGRGPLEVVVDGRLAVSAGSAGIPAARHGQGARADLELAPGVHHFRVTYRKPAMTDPLARVRLQTHDGEELRMAPSRAAAKNPGRHNWLAPVTTFAVVAAALLLAVAVVWAYGGPRALLRRLLAAPGRVVVLGACGLVLCAGLFNLVIPLGSATVNLYSGDDPLVYEGCARNILFHGLLMPNGAEPGSGAPYYHYPLYSYAIAATHLLLGEAFSAVVFLNLISISSVVILCWFLAWRELPEWIAASGALAVGAFTVSHVLPYAATAFPDNLFIAAVFLALLLCERALLRDHPALWVAAGIAAAAAAATRPSFLTHAVIWPLAVVFLGKGLWTRRLWQGGLFSAGFLLGLAPFAVRNWIMARRLVLLVNSWIQIPYFLYPPNEPNLAKPVSSLPEAIQQAWVLFTERPWDVAAIELRKVLFSLGLTGFGPPNVGSHHLLFLGFLLFCTAMVLRRVPRALALVLVAFALSHTLAMVLSAPWTYGYKTILPLHVMFLAGGVYLLSVIRAPVASGATTTGSARG